MKKVGIALIVIIAVIAGALYWLRNNLDSLVRDAIVKYGSEMTQAKVSVGSVKIDAVNGEGIISDFQIGNPQGFKTPYAFKVKEFTVAIDPTTLTGNVITVKKIAIDAPDVIYEKGDSMTNFDAIQKNIADYLLHFHNAIQNSLFSTMELEHKYTLLCLIQSVHLLT